MYTTPYNLCTCNCACVSVRNFVLYGSVHLMYVTLLRPARVVSSPPLTTSLSSSATAFVGVVRRHRRTNERSAVLLWLWRLRHCLFVSDRLCGVAVAVVVAFVVVVARTGTAALSFILHFEVFRAAVCRSSVKQAPVTALPWGVWRDGHSGRCSPLLCENFDALGWMQQSQQNVMLSGCAFRKSKLPQAT